MQFVPIEEGYYDFVEERYVYNYTDHLGNIRLSYAQNKRGEIEIIEENNYYPFGLKHEGYNNLVENSKYQYKYNGKELQESGMYDYGARFYMPELGRWGVIDPLAEKVPDWSSYRYGFNNPIRYIDPNGMWEYECDTCPSPEYLEQMIKDDVGRSYVALHKNENDKTLEWVLDGRKIREVDLGVRQRGGWTPEQQQNIDNARSKYYEAIGNCSDCQALERGLFVYLPMTIFTGGISKTAKLSTYVIKAISSSLIQLGINENIDLIDVAADTFLSPGASGIVGGAYDYNLIKDQEGKRFNNNNTIEKVLFNGVTSKFSSSLGKRYNPVINNMKDSNVKQATSSLIDINNSIIEQSLNKAYEKK